MLFQQTSPLAPFKPTRIPFTVYSYSWTAVGIYFVNRNIALGFAGFLRYPPPAQCFSFFVRRPGGVTALLLQRSGSKATILNEIHTITTLARRVTL